MTDSPKARCTATILLASLAISSPVVAQDKIPSTPSSPPRVERPGPKPQDPRQGPADDNFSQPVRLLAEAGGGLVGGALGTLGGAVLGAAYGNSNGGGFAALGYFILGAAAGNILFMPLGTWAGGTLADGNGSILFTYLGGGAGVVGGALLTAALGSVADGDWLFPVSLALLVIFPLGGAMLGYELTHDDEDSQPKLRVVEGLSPTFHHDPQRGQTSLGLRLIF
jgi:hypothetical protein